jgi:hypothetical protein
MMSRPPWAKNALRSGLVESMTAEAACNWLAKVARCEVHEVERRVLQDAVAQRRARLTKRGLQNACKSLIREELFSDGLASQ